MKINHPFVGFILIGLAIMGCRKTNFLTQDQESEIWGLIKNKIFEKRCSAAKL